MILKEFPNDRDIAQKRHFADGLAVLRVQQSTDGHGHASRNVDDCRCLARYESRHIKPIYRNGIGPVKPADNRLHIGRDIAVVIDGRLHEIELDAIGPDRLLLNK